MITLTAQARFTNSVRGMPVDRPAVWFMRQAGRHLPEYRELRTKASFMDLCFDAAICAEASCQPWRRYDVDGIVVFNDILIPLRDMGMGLDFAPGPVFSRLIQTPGDAAALARPSYTAPPPVAVALEEIRRQVGSGAALIGFVGGPLTMAAYAVAGASKTRLTGIAECLHARRAAFEAMADLVVPVLTGYAVAQVRGGADVIQIFESSAADVDQATYRDLGLPRLERLIASLASALPNTPLIVFGRGIWPFIRQIAGAGAACISLDAAQPLAAARATLRTAGLSTALQGNLPSETLKLPPAQAAQAARDLIGDWRRIVINEHNAATHGPTGWVFNLGHGVPADADPASVAAVVAAVRAFEFPA